MTLKHCIMYELYDLDLHFSTTLQLVISLHSSGMTCFIICTFILYFYAQITSTNILP